MAAGLFKRTMRHAGQTMLINEAEVYLYKNAFLPNRGICRTNTALFAESSLVSDNKTEMRRRWCMWILQCLRSKLHNSINYLRFLYCLIKICTKIILRFGLVQVESCNLKSQFSLVNNTIYYIYIYIHNFINKNLAGFEKRLNVLVEWL